MEHRCGQGAGREMEQPDGLLATPTEYRSRSREQAEGGGPIIALTAYRAEWPIEFQEIGGALRLALGDLGLRIDHIGSTAIPGLCAKDKIDVQVTVLELQPDVEKAIGSLGYSRVEDIQSDHVPPGQGNQPEKWRKWVFRGPTGQRPTNLHVRVAGWPNQRYPLLFRDYLRSHAAAAEAYARVKRALARLHPDDLDAYYEVKDPVCDLIFEAAEGWAASVVWKMGPSDC